MMFYIVVTDSISIIENLDALGYETPAWIRKYLLDAKENMDKGKMPERRKGDKPTE